MKHLTKRRVALAVLTAVAYALYQEEKNLRLYGESIH